MQTFCCSLSVGHDEELREYHGDEKSLTPLPMILPCNGHEITRVLEMQ